MSPRCLADQRRLPITGLLESWSPLALLPSRSSRFDADGSDFNDDDESVALSRFGGGMTPKSSLLVPPLISKSAPLVSGWPSISVRKNIKWQCPLYSNATCNYRSYTRLPSADRYVQQTRYTSKGSFKSEFQNFA